MGNKISEAVIKKCKNLNDVGTLYEMAIIGRTEHYVLKVYFEPLKNPSFHVEGNDFEIVLKIKDLKILEIKYASKRYDFKKGALPPTFLLKDIKEFMMRPVDDLKITEKGFLVRTWNLQNPNTPIDIEYISW